MCVSRKWKSAFSSNDVQSSFVANLGKPALKLSINWNRPMGSMLCRDHKGSSGIRHFQRAVNPLKMNPALEDLQCGDSAKGVLTCSCRIFFISRIYSCKTAPTCRLRASTWPIVDPALCSTTSSIFCPSFSANRSSSPCNNFWFRASFFLLWGLFGTFVEAFVPFQFYFSHHTLTASGRKGDILWF